MIKAIVTDIEGTTSSLSFVHDVLFPYAREHLAEFVRSHAEDPTVVSHLNDVRLEVGEDLSLDGIIDQLLHWIAEDKKITPLKALQGMIWEAGYKDGRFTGHVYADAVEYLKNGTGWAFAYMFFPPARLRRNNSCLVLVMPAT